MPEYLPSWIVTPPVCLLLDTEPLVAFVVGSFDRRMLGKKVTERFSPDDFELLELLVGQFDLVSTPHILAEVNSWIGQLGQVREEIRYSFAKQIPGLLERYTESSILSQDKYFSTVGLTDMSVIHTAQHVDALVITTDGTLFQLLNEAKIPALLYSQLGDYRRSIE